MIEIEGKEERKKEREKKKKRGRMNKREEKNDQNYSSLLSLSFGAIDSKYFGNQFF